MGRGRAVQLWQAVAVVATLTGLYACSDRTPTGALVGEVALAKGSGRGGGGGGSGTTPVVDSTNPSSSPQDVRLNVTVRGSGFDDGSTVRFLLDGRAVTTMTVHSTTFSSSEALVADVSVALDAAVDRYDVEVTTRGGKKGIGIEKFAVTGPTAELPTATVDSPPGVYGDGAWYVGGILTNSQENGGSSGNFNFKAFCDEGRSFDVRLPWAVPGEFPDCYGTLRVNLHFPGLMFANTDCPDPGCPIGEPPRKKGGFGPSMNYFFSVRETTSGGQLEDKLYNVVWTNATYVVLRRVGTAPCEWRVRGSVADLHQADFVPLYSGGSVALDVIVTRYDGACSS